MNTLLPARALRGPPWPRGTEDMHSRHSRTSISAGQATKGRGPGSQVRSAAGTESQGSLCCVLPQGATSPLETTGISRALSVQACPEFICLLLHLPRYKNIPEHFSQNSPTVPMHLPEDSRALRVFLASSSPRILMPQPGHPPPTTRHLGRLISGPRTAAWYSPI